MEDKEGQKELGSEILRQGKYIKNKEVLKREKDYPRNRES